jgi:hypothetical protein
MVMPWRCPICRLPINHNETEIRPRPGLRYRCYVCRLDLMLNEASDSLELQTWSDEGQTQPTDADEP